jgi:hypothetical protein
MVIVLILLGAAVLICLAVAAWRTPQPTLEDKIAQARADVRWAEVELSQQSNAVRRQVRSTIDAVKEAAYREMESVDRD